jgi:hypothetical protein
MSAKMKIDFNFDSFVRKNIFNSSFRSSERGFFTGHTAICSVTDEDGVISLGFRIEDGLRDTKEKHSCVYRIAYLCDSTLFDVLVPNEQTFTLSDRNASSLNRRLSAMD